MNDTFQYFNKDTVTTFGTTIPTSTAAGPTLTAWFLRSPKRISVSFLYGDAATELLRWQPDMQKTVRTNYVLIDYENVQPAEADLKLLADKPFKVKVFLKPRQKGVPVDLAAALQPLGPNAEYEQLASAGKNAVDFHIAYFIGVLSTQDSSAFFHVISKDKGFDPLLKHLKNAGVFAHRSPSIASMPCFKPALPCDSREETVVAHLTKLKAAKPRTVKTLLNTLYVLFKKELSKLQISAILSSLRKRGFVKVEGTKVTYALPA